MTAVGELVTPTGVLVMDAETMAADRDAWLAARRWRQPEYVGIWPDGLRIGSSEVPSILDLDGVGTPVHVFRDKVLGVREPANERMQWGHLFEGVIAEEWKRRNRCVVDEIGLVAHISKPWHQSTIDRRVIECPTVKGLRNDCGLEVKNVGYASAERWGRDLPDRILAQIVHQLYVTGYDHMHYACNIGGNMMKQGIVWNDREQDLLGYIVREVDRFRDEHLLTGVEPPWSDSKAEKLIALDNATHPVRVGEATIEEIGVVMEYVGLVAQLGPLEKRKKALSAEMRRIADGAAVVTFGGDLAYQYKDVPRTHTDLDLLKQRYPQAYDECVIEKTSPTLYVGSAYKIKPRKADQ